jgi:hypothetical protein
MSKGAGQCRRRQVWPAEAGNCYLVPVIALFMSLFIGLLVLAAARPVPAVGPDLLHEEIGVDYDELAAGVQSAYAKARARTVEAARILFPDDGDEYAADAIDAAMALYEDSLAIVRETESKYSQAYEKLPLLFVQLDYLVVKNLNGMAAIFSLRGELDAAYELRTTLIPMAQENRTRIAVAIERNILPQFQDQYLEIDDSFRQLLAESYVWMGVDAEAAGDIDDARTNYALALDFSDNPESHDAIRVLLDRIEFMHDRAVLTAGGDDSLPPPDPAAEDGGPATPAAGDAPDALPVDAGSDH